MPRKINPNLRRLAELTHNPELKMPDLEDDKHLEQETGAIQVNANINPREYIQIPNIKGLFGELPIISAYEVQGYNDLKWQEAHFKLFENKLYMPTPAIFMAHFANVVDAFKGKTKLFYADSSKVPNSEIQELYKHLTSDYKDIYGYKNPGAWTWLNAFFSQGKIKYAIGVKNKQLDFREETLETCLMQDVFADFRKLSSQGLPTVKKGDLYIQGENIYFLYPRAGFVADLIAGPGAAGVGCNRLPDIAGASLGVFACAQKIERLIL